ncbi:MAG: hypothetical protein SA339_11645 [Methanomassiliicoccus sp.]|nr:hypothetical protein [Methanomassiliicoccus sp.]
MSDTARNRPIKFRILEICSDGKTHWNSDIVKTIQSEYEAKSAYARDSINFDIIELAAGGMLKEVDVKQDDGTYKKGALLHKYVITDFGILRAKESCFAGI